jgi:hypothetical protein
MLRSSDVRDRRVLLLDNDALTGRSTKVLVEYLLEHGKAAKVGALFIYRYTNPGNFNAPDLSKFDTCYLDIPRVIGHRLDGQAVLDSLPQLRQIRQLSEVKFLETDFPKPTETRRTIQEIRRRLVR